MKERTARTSSSTALLGLAALAVIPSCQAFAPWGFSPVQQLQSASNTKSVAACASTRRSSITSCNYYRFSSALSHVHDPRIAAVDVRRRLRGLQVLGATSAPSVEVDGDGSAVDVEDSPVVVGEEQEEVKPKTVKPRKKRAPAKKPAKKKAKGADLEKGSPPPSGRVTITLDDLAAAQDGVPREKLEEFPDGWDFVEEGEENDEDDEVPFWTGPEPELNEDGKLKGIEPEAVRIANKAFSVKEETINVKVHTDTNFHWYLLRCFATYELRCRDAVDGFVHAWGLGGQIDKLWVPTRQVPRQLGKSVTFKEEPIYQGYIYCRVKMSTELRNMVNDMDKIVGFVGDKRDEDKKLIPNRLDEADIQGVQESEKALGANGVPNLMNVGDLVELKEGPFALKKGEISKVKDGEYVVKVNANARNSNVHVSWDGVRKLSELEVETWFEETRRALDATYMDREKRRAGRGRGRGAGRTRREGFDDEGGRGRGRGRGRGEERGLRGFSGSGMRGRGDTEDEEEFARRRFMEKDLELWESASTRPASKPKSRRPSGDKVDAELPEKAFESDRDADNFFEGLDAILGTPSDDRRLPVMPGARAQGPSMVERAHAAASQDRFDQLSSSFSGPPIRESGSMGAAGGLEAGVRRVRRDAPTQQRGSGLDKIDPPQADDDDDFFTALMQELKEATPSSQEGQRSDPGDASPAPPPVPQEPRGGLVDDLDDLLAGLGEGKGLAGSDGRGDVMPAVGAGSRDAAGEDREDTTNKPKTLEGIEDIFSDLGLEALPPLSADMDDVPPPAVPPSAPSTSARTTALSGTKTPREASSEMRRPPSRSRDVKEQVAAEGSSAGPWDVMGDDFSAPEEPLTMDNDDHDIDTSPSAPFPSRDKSVPDYDDNARGPRSADTRRGGNFESDNSFAPPSPSTLTDTTASVSSEEPAARRSPPRFPTEARRASTPSTALPVAASGNPPLAADSAQAPAPVPENPQGLFSDLDLLPPAPAPRERGRNPDTGYGTESRSGNDGLAGGRDPDRGSVDRRQEQDSEPQGRAGGDRFGERSRERSGGASPVDQFARRKDRVPQNVPSGDISDATNGDVSEDLSGPVSSSAAGMAEDIVDAIFDDLFKDEESSTPSDGGLAEGTESGVLPETGDGGPLAAPAGMTEDMVDAVIEDLLRDETIASGSGGDSDGGSFRERVSFVEGGDAKSVTPEEKLSDIASASDDKKPPALVESGGESKGGGNLSGLKVVDLKAKCKSMGLPVSGKKAELQDRILKAMDE